MGTTSLPTHPARALVPILRGGCRCGSARRDGLQPHDAACPSSLGIADEYEALVNAVTIWDVASERQVEIEGPDALALTQYLCTRDVSKVKVGQARYTFICNHEGGILNDPVLLRVDENRYWLSLSDRDVLLWAQGIAGEHNWDARVREPDVSPMQIQGPHSSALIEDVFGPEIAELSYYRCRWTELAGVKLLVSRTDGRASSATKYSSPTARKGRGPGRSCSQRGSDTVPSRRPRTRFAGSREASSRTEPTWDDSINPFQLGFDRMVQFDAEDDFIGRAAAQTDRRAGSRPKADGGQGGRRADVLQP